MSVILISTNCNNDLIKHSDNQNNQNNDRHHRHHRHHHALLSSELEKKGQDSLLNKKGGNVRGEFGEWISSVHCEAVSAK